MMLQPYAIDPDNRPMQYAYDLISRTNTSFFLTGKAGTGKTTFIKYVLETVDKAFAVVVPTGIAALNAGGRTIHSFFGFPPAVLGPGDIGRLSQSSRDAILGGFDSEPVDTIIIDEVSMVRCDVLDCIDRTLRRALESSAPFGGLQMVFVGDLYQLDPVVTEADRPILEENYGEGDYHFFSAWCIDKEALPKIELTKVYRQKEAGFVRLLGRVRTGQADEMDLEVINRTTANANDYDEGAMSMYMSAYRKDADRINELRLSQLNSELVVYEALYEGDCSSLLDVIEPKITLKVGTQVVFIKNDEDKQWANGTMGVVQSLGEETVGVLLETGDFINVPRASWDATELAYDKQQRRTVAKWKGTMKQFPLKVAWAVTIHKSQSMTYSRATVDLGKGAFGAGQVYVALSRLQSLAGLTLVKPLNQRSIIVDPGVARFHDGVNNEEQIHLELRAAEAIDEFLDNNQYDDAADALFRLFVESAAMNDTYQANTFLARYYSLVIDDRSIHGPVVSHTCCEGFSQAAISFYAGNPEQALSLLDEMDEDETNFNATYLRMRCYEELGRLDDVEELLSSLLFDCEMDVDHSAPTIHHRKILWTVLMYPRFVSLPILSEAINALIDDIRMYDRLYHVIRRIVCKIPVFRQRFSASENFLAKATLDSAYDDSRYIETVLYYRNPDPWLRNELTERTAVWEGYLTLLLNLKNTK